MATEDAHFIHGPGHNFRGAYFMANRGADAPTLAKTLMRGLRKECRAGGGPTDLLRLARTAGVVAEGDRPCFAFPVTPDELERLLRHHHKAEDPRSVCDSQVVQDAWNRTQYTGLLRGPKELLEMWCLARLGNLFFGRIEQGVEGLSVDETLKLIDDTRGEASRLLRGEDQDIIERLRHDSSGRKVRARAPQKKERTADLLYVPLHTSGNYSP